MSRNVYQLVLVRGDCSEHGLGKDEGHDKVRGQMNVTESLGRRLRSLLLVTLMFQSCEVNARLVFVHRI